MLFYLTTLDLVSYLTEGPQKIKEKENIHQVSAVEA